MSLPLCLLSATLVPQPMEEAPRPTGDVAALEAVRAAIATNLERFPAGRALFLATNTEGPEHWEERTSRARGVVRWDRGGDRVRLEYDREVPSDFPAWGEAHTYKMVSVRTPQMAEQFRPIARASSRRSPPRDENKLLRVWPSVSWYRFYGPRWEKKRYEWPGMFAYPAPWTTLLSAHVERDGEEVVVTERYKNGAERTIRCSFAVGGNVVAYDLRAWKDVEPGRFSYDSGTFEWVEHTPGTFRLSKLQVREGAEAEPNPEADWTYTLEIEEFETVERWPDDTFTIDLPPGTQLSVTRNGRTTRRTLGRAAPKGVTEADLDDLAESARGAGLGAGDDR